MEKKTLIISVLLFIAFSMMFIKIWKDSSALVKSDVPLVNDAWYDALQAIKKDSEQNPGQPWEKAIITSWWDFGHHFKYLSDRGVTFDGGTQVSPQAHWTGKLFLTSDEEESVAILRMLDCGGNSEFERLNKELRDTSKSVHLLNEMFKNGSKFCDSPTPAYIIASEDMIGKAGVWAHFGGWNFDRAEQWVKVKPMKKEEAVRYILSQSDWGITSEARAEQLWSQLQTMTESDANNFISPWPGYAGISNCREENKSLVCENGAIIKDGEPNIKPQSFVYVKEGKIVETKYNNASIGYSMTLTPDNKLVLSSPELANSLFTKLFFINATGLKHFTLLTKTQNIDGFKIYVYKVQWNVRSD